MDIISTDPYGTISPPRHVLYLRQLKRKMGELAKRGLFFVGPVYDPFLFEFHDDKYVRAVRDQKDSLEQTIYDWNLLTFEEHWNYAACVYHAAREAIETGGITPAFAPNQGLAGFSYGQCESVFNGEATTAIRMWKETRYRVAVVNLGPVYPTGTRELLIPYPEISLIGSDTSANLPPLTRFLHSLDGAMTAISTVDPQIVILTINPSWCDFIGHDKFIESYNVLIDSLQRVRRPTALILGNPPARKATRTYERMIQAVWR